MTFDSFSHILNIANMRGATGWYDKNKIIKEKLGPVGWDVHIKYKNKLWSSPRYRENEDGTIDASLDRMSKDGKYEFKDPKDIRKFEVVINNKDELIMDIFEDKHFQQVLKGE